MKLKITTLVIIEGNNIYHSLEEIQDPSIYTPPG